MPERGVRVREAAGCEAIRRLAAAEACLLVGERCDSREQRTVEDPLVQFTHIALDVLPPPEEALRIAHVHRPREPAKIVRTGRHEMGPRHAPHLQPVLQKPQEPVVLVELCGVLAADVAALAEGPECIEARACPDMLVGRAVHELQQLHGELDVAQSSGTELELTVHLVRGDVLGDPLTHPVHRLHEVLARGRRPHEGGDGLLIGLSECPVASHIPGFQQRLELPVLRPSVIVGGVGVQCAGDLAVPALGPQVRVHLPERRLLAQARAARCRLAREQLRDQRRAMGVESFLGCMHPDHIDVAQVVQLARAQLSHADHSEADTVDIGLREALRSRAPSHGKRGLQRCGCDVTERGCDRRHARHRILEAEIVRGDLDQMTSVPPPQRSERGHTLTALHRLQQAVAVLVHGTGTPRLRREDGGVR